MFCRIRPTLPFEKRRPLALLLNTENSVTLTSLAGNTEKFTFDRVFGYTSTRSDIFQSVSPYVQYGFDGNKVCIFSYRQTNSGKSFTTDGLFYDVIEYLFTLVTDSQIRGWKYAIRAKFIEVFNETVYDMLGDVTKNPDVKEHIVCSSSALRRCYIEARSSRNAAICGQDRISCANLITEVTVDGFHEEEGKNSNIENIF